MRLAERTRLSLGAFRTSGANHSLRLVQVARLASVTGRWAYTIALAVFAYESSGAGGVALAGIVRLVPAALAAPFAGALARRARLDVLLLAGGLLRTAALAGAGVLILTEGALVAIYALVAVEAATSTIMRPIQNSLMPALSRTPEELTSTNLALSVIESSGVFLGPLIGAALLNASSVGMVFVAGAAAYLVSTGLLVPLRVPRTPLAPEVERAGLVREALLGARAVGADPNMRVVVTLYGAQNLVAGALNVLIVVTALRLLDLGQSGVGTLTAAVGLGGVVGGAVVFARLRSGRHGSDLGIGLVLWGVPLLLLALVSSQGVALALLAVVGVGVTMVDVAAVTLLQRSATADLLAHALGLLQAVFVTSVAVGTLLAPVLVAAVGVRGALLVTGAFLPALALGLSRRLRRLDARPAELGPLVELLEAIPVFAPLPERSLEHLAASLRPLALSPGDVVFAQGDGGDGFYIVVEGVAEVLIDGRHVRDIGPGGSFGEIALLRDVPRTATIRARTTLQLQRLDRDRFLGTVTGNAASADAANAIVGSRLGLRSGLSAA